ncbi:MAG: 4-hydroxy-3-methylbut-2-enyl diphosphate reductase, partial [Desulfomicrobium sp.]|nr:4-hydroxy-3-methylbut-2-enyl diphosphate reductase [Desulfomicrobium sp.]
MELTIAETAGFCMGVDMALHKLDNALSSLPHTACIYTLGPIIHNPQVLARYKSQGVLQTDGSLPLKAGD